MSVPQSSLAAYRNVRPALSIPALATRLGVTRQYLYDRVNGDASSLPPFLRMPGSGTVRFLPEDVDAWIAKLKAESRHTPPASGVTPGA